MEILNVVWKVFISVRIFIGENNNISETCYPIAY